MKKLFGAGAVGAMLWLVLPVMPAAAGGGGCYGPVSKGHSTTVEMKDMCFFPTVTVVKEGADVTFVNRDGMKHYISGANGTWNTKVIKRGAAATVSLEEPGVYPYFCPFHWSMQGVVVVGDGLGPGAAERKGVRVTEFVRPVKPEPVPTPSPVIVRVPEKIEVERDPGALNTAALVWGGAGAGLLGGFLIQWGSRRRSSEP